MFRAEHFFHRQPRPRAWSSGHPLKSSESGDYLRSENTPGLDQTHTHSGPKSKWDRRTLTSADSLAVGWDNGADRASNDADVSIVLPNSPWCKSVTIRWIARMEGLL